ncbi:hypothetical protein CCYA_CCYA09G2616 [Cyanidiococcus yangmingshanensis]|nr:hypothetical protein CCYA_CCYA09G2616 [Cyanidiococcus yangmingshanensis]
MSGVIPTPTTSGTDQLSTSVEHVLWSATISVVDYVCRLREEEIDELFDACELAVFGILRALPSLAKIILFRFIALSGYVDEVPARVVGSWIADPRTEERDDPVWGWMPASDKTVEHSSLNIEAERSQMVSRTLHTLTRLRFLRRADQERCSVGDELENVAYTLTPRIRDRLWGYLWKHLDPRLLDNGDSSSAVDADAADSKLNLPDTKLLEPFQCQHRSDAAMKWGGMDTGSLCEYTRRSWEHILHFVIGMPLGDSDLSPGTSSAESVEASAAPPSDEVVEALLSLGVSEQVGQEGMRITERGFSYLLLDIHSQIWALLEAVIEGWSQVQHNRREFLDLLFRLGFATPGQAYAAHDPSLSITQRRMLGFLAEIGVVYLGNWTQQVSSHEDTLDIIGKRPQRRDQGPREVDDQAPDGSVTRRPRSLEPSRSRARRVLLNSTPGSEDEDHDIYANRLTFDPRRCAQMERDPESVFFTPTPLGTQIMMGTLEETLDRNERQDQDLQHTEILIESGPLGPVPSVATANRFRSSVTRSSPFQIVVETNFRLYAYSASMFQVALLSLFARILYRMPGLAIGVITRDSVRRALKCGIAAKQLLHFLTIHAMEGKGVPFNVHDQILLWELERKRIQVQPGVLLESFEPMQDGRAFFEQVQEYTIQLGAQRWCDPVRQLLVLDASAFDSIREWIRRQARTLS